MRSNLPVLVIALTLAACAGSAPPIDAQKLLMGFDVPKIPSIEDTLLLASAKNAEQQGDFAQAAQLYQQALSKQPDNKTVALSLAESYRRSGEYDHAIPLYDGLIAQDPNLTAAKEGKGLALLATGDYQTPGKIFEDIMKTEPTRWKTLNGLGILFITRNLQPEAQLYFKEALKYSPSNPSIMNNFGLSQALQRSYDPSIASLTQAATLAPAGSVDRKRIDLNLAMVYATSGKLDQARAIAETYFSGPALDNNLGLYAHLAKDDQMAKAYFNMALTGSKMFYEKAWDNLQTVNNATIADLSPSAPAPAPKIAQSDDYLSNLVSNVKDTVKAPKPSHKPADVSTY